ncbi:MAG: cell division protein FtsL [Pseudomonadota bacterium]
MRSVHIVLFVLIMLSAWVVVTVRHQNRLAFIELQQHEKQKQQLQTEWGRLMIERATWTHQRNVAKDANDRLAMSAPSPEKIVTVELSK